MRRIERNSGCKVNLLLNIVGKRPDGFHELERIMQPIPLHDALHFECQTAPGIELTCSRAELPTDSRNLVYRAAELFLKTTSITVGVRIRLEKRIPLAAGLGGGSANAAVTLLGLNELLGAGASAEMLQSMASQLGSDVPFFLQEGPALATGRGEKITRLKPFAALRDAYVLLIHPGFGVSTPWAYQALTEFPDALKGRPERTQRLLEALTHGTFNDLVPLLYNTLELPVLRKYPVLKLYQEFLRDNGAAATLMSGSGSTTFGLLPDQETGRKLLKSFAERFGTEPWTACLPL